MTKRLETRLKSLESDRPESGITHPECKLLVCLLGRRDALFWPWRYSRGYRSLPEINRRAREYLSGEIGLQAKADGKGKWKEAHAMRQRLLAMQLIDANHSGGQVTNVFLTPLGEATARALVGPRLKTLNDEAPKIVFLKIRAHQREDNLGHVRESILWGRPCVGSPTDWDDLTEWTLPLLTANLICATTDTCGRILFYIVDEHENMTYENFPKSVVVDIPSAYEFDDLYVDSFDAERKMLDSIAPRDPNEIFIPIPASVAWGVQK